MLFWLYFFGALLSATLSLLMLLNDWERDCGRFEDW